jgi:signal transduction histidine kinase
MNPQEQAKLFVPFQRAGQARMVSGGIGLGLRIAAEIVKQHGGSMGVASERGMGSAFTITLPR